MPKGQEYSKEFKQLAFSVINFVEQEKNGVSIPLYNVNERLKAMLGISKRSIFRLKAELKSLKQEEKDLIRTRRTSSSSSASSINIFSIPSSPRKYLAGRSKVQLTEFEQDTIRLTFHQLLNEKVYPTVENLLSTLLKEDPNFPIQSKMSLWRQMRLIGFKYRQTSKSKILFDTTAFQAQRAYYFRKLDELRATNTVLYYHDETWLNKNEEKTFVWFDDSQRGRLRSNEGKGQRLAISGMISMEGFHLRSLDIFKCDEVHSMDSSHFIEWIDHTASNLRDEHGKTVKIAIIIDNATWHNKLTPETEPPKRAWRKGLVQEWLAGRNIKFEPFMTKAELLEVAFENLLSRQYIVDKVAAKYNVEIVRIPIKHCVLNPIELAWAGLKNYVRQLNVNFSLNDVAQLCSEWLSACGPDHAANYFNHARKHEEAFKNADQIAENLENDLIDTDTDVDTSSDDEENEDD